MKKAALIAGILGAVIIGSSITITQQNEYKKSDLRTGNQL